ncbi:MlaE family ABC transporter permease [Pseudobdellovibrio exovorus]|uniref:ABC-type organic solvent resistance transport system permease protein n=1 Tax=Pseudobdellovibrio exovorus JSS TaxID=1184267 RepID=M4VCI1_9BACT|nr:ABC transporter permease [Pseudobdellovibrio exovorus]AGH96190.1 ABC-type organic solvent resistance transport system permease protein [Pseudobdellovibrio exovorus JSS]
MSEENVKTTWIQRWAAKIDTTISVVVDSFVSSVREVGLITIFAWQSLRLLFVKPYRYGEVLKHMEFIGNQSVGIITLTSIFTGLALSFQVYLGFKLVNAVDLVGPTVALGISRELGPVLTGLIVAARAGGAMAARLGTMRVNEQMDALDVMGVNTKQYLIAPRLIAAIICMPLLTALFDFMAMFGSWILCTKLVGLDHAVFMSKIAATVEVRHINEGLIKAAIFGLVFAVICTYKGFNTSGGAKGVGEATNRGVVISMVSIIILDYFLMNLIRIFYVMTGIG